MFRDVKTAIVTVVVIVAILAAFIGQIVVDAYYPEWQYRSLLTRVMEAAVGIASSFLIGYWAFKSYLIQQARSSIRNLTSLYENTARLHQQIQTASNAPNLDVAVGKEYSQVVEGLYWQIAMIVNSLHDWENLDPKGVEEFRTRYRRSNGDA